MGRGGDHTSSTSEHKWTRSPGWSEERRDNDLPADAPQKAGDPGADAAEHTSEPGLRTERPGDGHERSGWRPRERHSRLPIARRARIFIIATLAVALIIGVVAADRVAVSRSVEVSTIASPGKTQVELSSEQDRPLSPGCGCLDPSWGAHEWYGMNVPSSGFDLSVKLESSQKNVGKKWGLTAMSPALEPIDWYASPDHSVRMRVTVGDGSNRRRVFSGRTTFALLLTEAKVQVAHGERFPYAALLPASGGRTEFESEAGTRTEFGGSLNARATSPARDDDDDLFELKGKKTEEAYQARKDVNLRGPMVDLLGPTIRFQVERADDLEVYAGARRVTGFAQDDPVAVEVTTPFAVRLFPHPAPKPWMRDLATNWSHTLSEAKRGNRDAKEAAKTGQVFQGRHVQNREQPRYSLRLDDIAVPSPDRWTRFARRSANNGSIDAMLANIEEDGGYTTTYQLPPVNPETEVGVFGPVTRLDSTALSGEVAVQGQSERVGRGQRLVLESDKGVATGRYQMTPLISAGTRTSQADAAGDARVSIDGRAITRLPIVPWLVGGVGAAVLALLVEGLRAWVSRSPPQGRPTAGAE